MELRRLVLYDLREHAAWLPAHAACRGAVSSRKKRQLTKAALRAVGGTPRLMTNRVGPNGHPRLAAEFATPMSVQHLGVQYPHYWRSW